jgi:outer membrane immunogenic protein
MKTQIVVALALTTLAGSSALAADIAVRRAAPVAVGPAFNCAAGQFGGAHVGIHAGSVYHQAHRQDTDGFLTDNAGWTMNKWAGHAGGGIGYDWTTCSTVWGIELDASWLFATKNFLPDNPNAGPAGDGITTRADWLATARLRSGVALDNLLIYATGGVAASRFRTTWVNAPNTFDSRETRFGWVAGLGTEWAWSRNVSFKFETLYVGFTDRDRSVVIAGPATFNFTHSDSMWISRIGLNYRWGAPVVARY